MPNDEHVILLRRGADAWNSWRAERDDTPDLSQANLRGAYLRLAKLDAADLSDAHLEAVEGLTPAQLDRAQLNSGTQLPEGLIGAENAER